MSKDRRSGRDVARLVDSLRDQGLPLLVVVEELCRTFDVNARAGWRLAHGWSQQTAAEKWTKLWPNSPKIGKNISYWELWPSKTGHEPSLEVLDKLAQLYGCRVADLISDLGDYTEPLRDDGRGELPTDRKLADNPPADWHTERVTVLLRLDQSTPEAIEERTIVASSDGLKSLDTSIGVPRHPRDQSPTHRITTEMLYGGSLRLAEQPSESQFRYFIDLAKPLLSGQQTEYILRFTVPEGQPMAPHYVHIPLRRSDKFRLRVRFPSNRLPQSVWHIAGMPPSVVYDHRIDARRLVVDKYGELCIEFRNLQIGYAYGIVWEPA